MPLQSSSLCIPVPQLPPAVDASAKALVPTQGVLVAGVVLRELLPHLHGSRAEPCKCNGTRGEASNGATSESAVAGAAAAPQARWPKPARSMAPAPWRCTRSPMPCCSRRSSADTVAASLRNAAANSARRTVRRRRCATVNSSPQRDRTSTICWAYSCLASSRRTSKLRFASLRLAMKLSFVSSKRSSKAASTAAAPAMPSSRELNNCFSTAHVIEATICSRKSSDGPALSCVSTSARTSEIHADNFNSKALSSARRSSLFKNSRISH
mmetsp:Transcript_19820/g.54693  ORF Transcript_19820/g.54693 Transcript_19820/m.54693 type:complete len:268 (-) Transcript_19820:533-1336(-)